MGPDLGIKKKRREIDLYYFSLLSSISIFLFSLLLHPNYAHRVGISRPLVRLIPRGNFLACLDPPSVHPNAFLAAPVQNGRGREIPLGLILASVKDACMPWAGFSPFPGFSTAQAYDASKRPFASTTRDRAGVKRWIVIRLWDGGGDRGGCMGCVGAFRPPSAVQ